MDIIKFKKLHEKFSKFPLDKGITQTAEYDEYIEASHDNEECKNYILQQHIKTSGLTSKHCCLNMTYYLTFDLNAKEPNPDAIVRYTKKTKEYGIPIHDGGTSFIKINYCPWCGRPVGGK